jgi:hypothetical protein
MDLTFPLETDMPKHLLTPTQFARLAQHILSAVKQFPCPSDDPANDTMDDSELDEAIQFANEERDAHLGIMIDGDAELPESDDLEAEIEMLLDYYMYDNVDSVIPEERQTAPEPSDGDISMDFT